jgi:hypothetical protein
VPERAELVGRELQRRAPVAERLLRRAGPGRYWKISVVQSPPGKWISWPRPVPKST